MTDTFMDHYLHVLYPTVDVKKTPLPSSWSATDKSNFLRLSNKKLRAHYTGHSLSVKDTSCVRSDYPIPLSCGLYYFEVKIIDKGLKCCIAIGIGTKEMKLHKLPGMQRNSFGYFGCSGGIFWGYDVGKNYGPPFSTDDIIGCGVNLVDRKIFYTKNGKNLGQNLLSLHIDEFSILALYPTVGLQTKGEIVEVNFGQSPFVYDIKKDIKKLKTTVASSITDFPLPNQHCELDATFRSIVSSYLVHQGYSSTAEAFVQSTNQELGEEKGSIESRKQILVLVLNGRIEEAIKTTAKLYPTLFDSRPKLFFQLKVYQFVEMIGTLENKVRAAAPLEAAAASLLAMQDELQLDVEMNEPSTSNVDLETMMDSSEDDCLEIEIDMADSTIATPPLCDSSMAQWQSSGEDSNRIMRITELGKELLILKSTLEKQDGVDNANNDLLAKAFSLMSNTRCPSECPGSELKDLAQREIVADALNSAILETIKLPGKSALHFIIGYARELRQLMDENGIGASAFADVDRLF